LTLRIVFYAIENLENHVCIIFLLNVISTHIIPESDQNRIFSVFDIQNHFLRYLKSRYAIFVVFFWNFLFWPLVTPSGWLKPNSGNLIANLDSAQKNEHLTNFWKNFIWMSSFCVTGAGSFYSAQLLLLLKVQSLMERTLKCHFIIVLLNSLHLANYCTRRTLFY